MDDDFDFDALNEQIEVSVTQQIAIFGALRSSDYQTWLVWVQLSIICPGVMVDAAAREDLNMIIRITEFAERSNAFISDLFASTILEGEITLPVEFRHMVNSAVGWMCDAQKDLLRRCTEDDV